MANGHNRYVERDPLFGSQTKVTMGTAAIVLIAIIGAAVTGASWTSRLAEKVEQLSEVGREVKSDLSNVKNKVDNLAASGIEIKSDINNVKNDVSSIKSDVKSVQNSVNQISSETIKKR